ncbi:MAG: phage tail tape measure protein [Candidatus Glassbacteria bacterium]|nr:phage tail tape measure protein [Candidatus Glassbacteria bacterium]
METLYKLGVIFSVKDRLTGAMTRMQKMMGRFRSLTRTTGKAMVGMALGAGLAMVPTVSTYANFEKTMAAVGVVSGATENQIKRLTDKAIQLGIETEHSSNAAAQGFLQLSKAGFTVDQQLKAIRPSLLLATAGQLDLANASGTMAVGIKGFGLNVRDAARVTDVLIAATQKTRLRADEYEQSLGQLGPAATGANQGFEQMIALLGLLKDQGGTAIRRAEQIKTALISIQAPTGAAAKQISALVRDASGNLLPFADIVDRIEGKLQGMNKAAQDAALVKIFGREGLPVIQALRKAQFADPITGETLKGTAALRELERVLKNSQGTGRRFASVFLDTFAGKFQLLKGSIETFSNVVGKLFAEKLEPFVVGLTKGLNILIKWTRENPKAARNFRDAAIQAGKLVAAIGGVALAMAAIMFVLGPFATAFSLLFLNPIGLGLVTVLALVTSIAILIRRWEDFKQAVKDPVNIGGLKIAEFLDKIFNLSALRKKGTPTASDKLAELNRKIAEKPLRSGIPSIDAAADVGLIFKSELGNILSEVNSAIQSSLKETLLGTGEKVPGEEAPGAGSVFRIGQLILNGVNDPEKLVEELEKFSGPYLPAGQE